jgi:predicted NBD/HSP70 family sugar kinase
MRVIIENDATAAAIGELAIAPDDDFAVLYMSTGVGGAVIVGGRPFRGRSSNAVEIDHLPIVGGVRTCICGRIGCVGAEAQPLAVALIAAENPALKDRWGLSGAHDQGLADFERIARAAVAGDKDAVSLLHDSADALAVAVAAMFSFFDVDHLVLTGPAFVTAGPIYRDRIATSVRERIWHQDLHNPTIRVGGDVERSAATGAALQVLRIMMPNNPDGV